MRIAASKAFHLSLGCDSLDMNGAYQESDNKYWWHLSGGGAVVAALILLCIELWMHSDQFLYRYRSVFAAGRAMDKLLFVEAHRPRFLIVGNSRIDNAFDPKIVAPELAGNGRYDAFNLGVPGADACEFQAFLKRLEAHGDFAPGGIEYVLIGLDEMVFQREPSLGYKVFFSDRPTLLRQGYFKDFLASWIRLWGYSDNLKTLHEPEKLIRFVRSSFAQVEPVGGGAYEKLGYRPGTEGKFQNAEQLMRQEAGSQEPPNPHLTECFFSMLSAMNAQNPQVKIAVAFMPLFNREVLFLQPESNLSRPYLALANELTALGIPKIELDKNGKRDPGEFANAGHLNDIGAKRFSGLLRVKLLELWPDLFHE
jgi:hypothetical protein